MDRIIIVGASLAGANAARAARHHGHDGELVLVGAERHLPYDRPPLSKGYLSGGHEEERLMLRVVEDVEPEWMLGRRAVAFEPAVGGGGAVTLDDGEVLSGDGVVIATGARPRTLPNQPDVAGITTLRTLDDGRDLRDGLAMGPDHLVVVGFGFIGAEVAATARSLGWAVTIVEAADQPLGRVLGPDGGQLVAQLHRDHGVEVVLGAAVEELVAVGGRVEGLVLTDGRRLTCSRVVVGIGVVPETGWLESSGLRLDDGVVVDETALAAPGVVAAGDVARWPHPARPGRMVRVEQWDNAVEMGAYAGRRLVDWGRGAEVDPYRPVPWFWSDQYDRKIQLAGTVGPDSEVVQGSFEERRFVQLHLADDRVVGVLCWNRPRHAILGRRLLGEGAAVEQFRSELAG